MKRTVIIFLVSLVAFSSCSGIFDFDKKNESAETKIEFTPYIPPESTAITKRTNTKDIQEAFDRAARKDEPEKQMKIIKEFYDTDKIPQDKDVIKDLIKHPELIPYKPVLGDKMAFNNEKNIVILLDNYVFACFDDGIITGVLLLKYSKEGSEIKWKVMEKYISE